jgi:hypothetical protein
MLSYRLGEDRITQDSDERGDRFLGVDRPARILWQRHQRLRKTLSADARASGKAGLRPPRASDVLFANLRTGWARWIGLKNEPTLSLL